MSLITITHTIGCDALAIARRAADGLTVEIYDDSRLREEAFRIRGHRDTATSCGSGRPSIYSRWPSCVRRRHKTTGRS